MTWIGDELIALVGRLYPILFVLVWVTLLIVTIFELLTVLGVV